MAGGSASAAPSTATVCGATVSSAGVPWRRASSSRLPPQRTRVTSSGEPPPTAVQFAAKGRSRRAATWLSTSLPRLLPAATTALGSSRSISSIVLRAQPPGA